MSDGRTGRAIDGMGSEEHGEARSIGRHLCSNPGNLLIVTSIEKIAEAHLFVEKTRFGTERTWGG